jgi:hypothetical protein
VRRGAQLVCWLSVEKHVHQRNNSGAPEVHAPLVVSTSTLYLKINVKETWRGNQEWIIQRHWLQRVKDREFYTTNKTKQNIRHWKLMDEQRRPRPPPPPPPSNPINFVWSFWKKNMLTLNILGRTYIFEPFFTSFRQFCRIFRLFHSLLLLRSCSLWTTIFIRGMDRFFASYDYWTS